MVQLLSFPFHERETQKSDKGREKKIHTTAGPRWLTRCGQHSVVSRLNLPCSRSQCIRHCGGRLQGSLQPAWCRAEVLREAPQFSGTSAVASAQQRIHASPCAASRLTSWSEAPEPADMCR
ncbi:hypothetical protein NDU88_001676 [Pleurodeles waltl]|uniref:Uncharacterized protein n=1 Tax=Pleurodeles waltl TaxID=8319 RepID=A0AAV7VAY3_PLEWA|nr:hypothetical protein NDU88_001676 [Pleurodeles waltl]